jgi:hypothetical protein
MSMTGVGVFLLIVGLLLWFFTHALAGLGLLLAVIGVILIIVGVALRATRPAVWWY